MIKQLSHFDWVVGDTGLFLNYKVHLKCKHRPQKTTWKVCGYEVQMNVDYQETDGDQGGSTPGVCSSSQTFHKDLSPLLAVISFYHPGLVFNKSF
uniref:Uncharacterized protein n=1 Tax=Stegastes partitus TaxID=144197 RepID=A0A3B5A9T8_9TELE